MKPFALLLSAVLAQETPEPAPTPSPAPVEDSAPASAPATTAPAVATPAAVTTPATEAVAPSAASRPRGVDQVLRQLKRIKELPPAERQKAAEQLRKEFGNADVNPILPPGDLDLDRYADLPSVDQARVTARHFFSDLIAADSQGMLAHCGLPFAMEDRRIDRADELRAEWIKSLRAKRTDLLVLYDIELLTPAEMEKKFGPPPRRLSSWSWRAPNTYLAVANLSGHAAVLLLKPVGAAWQIIGFHD